MLKLPMIGLFRRGLAASRCEEMLLPLGGPANEFCYMDSTLRCRKSTTGIFDVFFFGLHFLFLFFCRVMLDCSLQLEGLSFENCKQAMDFAVALYLRR